MISILIEVLVCVLLAATIAHCVRLDRKLKLLKADEENMRRTIVDLVSATEKAERAVSTLRTIVNDCDKTVSTHLREAERQAVDLAGQIKTGDDIIARISRIVESASRAETVLPGAPPAPAASAPAPVAAPVAAPAPAAARVDPAASAQDRLAATLAAAQAFADRARRRVDGKAA